MPTQVKNLAIFDRQLERLEKKYPRTLDTVLSLVDELEQDARPGERVQGTGYAVYKTRLPNLAARRGKSGGFRIIYYVQLRDSVILLTIYSKTEQTDISVRELRQLVREASG